MTTTNTQIRGTCQACFGEFAMRHGELVNHGFSRPGHGYLVGRCPGVNHKPFEVECDLTKSMLEGVTVEATKLEQGLIAFNNSVPTLESITLVKRDYNTKFGTKEETVVRAEVRPWAWDKAVNERRWNVFEQPLRGALQYQQLLKEKLTDWKPTETKAVQVRSGPVLHAKNLRKADGSALCGGGWSRRGRYTHKTTTEDLAKVTCTRCKARLEAR